MNAVKMTPATTLPFKGWDACPIKNIHIMQPYNPDRHDFATNQELRKIGEQEGFQVKKLPQGQYQTNWLQDAFVVNGKNSLIFTQGCEWEDIAADFAQKYGFKTKQAKLSVEGGNVFLGKKPNDEQFVLIGDQTLSSTEELLELFEKIYSKDPKKMMQLMGSVSGGNIEEVKKIIGQNLPNATPGVLKQKAVETFGVKSENVYTVPQANYHLDMFMRPVGYPYVLVNDPALALKNIEDIAKDPSGPTMSEADFKYLSDLYSATKHYSDRTYKKYEKTTDDVVQYLSSQGFKPIRIGAVYGEGSKEDQGCEINFINAIVNKRLDGKIGYITNGTSQKNEAQKRLEGLFEKQLAQEVPSGVGKVHFVRGVNDPCYKGMNSMTYMLSQYAAGIHCTCNEEPDFEAWG